VWLSDGFSAEGEVRLVGARLGANLTLHGAVLDHPGGPALNLERISAGDVQAAELTVRSGHVGFGRCQVAGSLDLSRSRLEGGDGPVLRLDNAAIGSLVLRALRASGEIIVRTARIEGRVLLERAEIRNPGGIALRMSRTEVGADVFCHGMTVEGTLKLARAVVGRHLDLEDAHLTAPGDVAVDARGLTAGQLSLLPGGPIQGTVVLRHARIGVLRDDPARWPERAALGGMTYDALEPALAARDRLRWLTRDPDGFQPQTYEQLAAHYVATGRHADGRVVMLARERHQRRTETALGRTWGLLQDVTTGYGYQPWRAVLWLVVLLAAGTVVYGNSPPRPLKPGEAPHFNAFAYTLDLLLPIVDLGQERALNPAGAHQWFAYALVAAGWVLATTIAAGAARVIGRRG
ncbi:MAG TPA: hypothetical protein VHJ17_14920, partial [Thermomonospora sp.]|nr:hypothetical protein [Thermomonospora sp.]